MDLNISHILDHRTKGIVNELGQSIPAAKGRWYIRRGL